MIIKVLETLYIILFTSYKLPVIYIKSDKLIFEYEWSETELADFKFA